MKLQRAVLHTILSMMTCLLLVDHKQGRAQKTSSATKAAFRSGLITGCSENRQKEVCICFGDSVVSRYEDIQLTAIYIQMKKNTESRKMFFLNHSPEMVSCMISAKKERYFK